MPVYKLRTELSNILSTASSFSWLSQLLFCPSVLAEKQPVHLLVYDFNFLSFLIRYKESFTRLRSLKTEIEHLQHLLEKAKVKMQKDFEIWWAEQAAFSKVTSPHSKP